MLTNVVDKLLFAFLLLAAFQVPVLSDHYLQFVSGYYESTKLQVESYQSIASKHDYRDVYAMIDDFKSNSNPAVRDDAEQKLLVMKEYEALQKAISTLKEGNLFEKAWFMFAPSRWNLLSKVWENFRIGIPLAASDILYSAIIALVLSFLIMWPIRTTISHRTSV